MKGKRIPIIAANWKMYKTISEMEEFLSQFLPLISDIEDRKVVIAPNFLCLERMVSISKGKNLITCAQNMYFEEEGAFTGEISPRMLKAIGVSWVILGHSERRHIFGEDDELIGKKVSSAVSHGMFPILCIGETLEERERGETGKVLKKQLKTGLSRLGAEGLKNVTIAYEPVWAIGTGKTASLSQIQEAHSLVREEIKKLGGEDIAEKIRILYGGSVKPDNVKGIMELEDVDGALVGGASLGVDSFIKIVKFDEN